MSTNTPATNKAIGTTTGSKKSSTPTAAAKSPAKKAAVAKPPAAKSTSSTTAQSTLATPKTTPKAATAGVKAAPASRKAPAKAAPQSTASAAATTASKKSKQPATVAIPATEEKVQKIKLVRDSFTIPENEYQAIGEIKKACLALGVDVKRTEVIRAGLLALQQMPIGEIADYISKKLPKPKTGRPKKAK